MDPTANRLLASLAPALLASLKHDLVSVILTTGQMVETAGDSIEFIYFLMDGVAVVGADAGGGRVAAAALIGREGATGTPVAMGDRIASQDTIIELGGSACRIAVDQFSLHLQRSTEFNAMMLGHARSLWLQTTSALASNAAAALDARLGRLLLMLQDRAGSELRVTHEFLARLLNARRAGTTVAIHQLEGLHLIRSSRSRLVVSDRAALMRHVGRYYGHAEASYLRLLGLQEAASH